MVTVSEEAEVELSVVIPSYNGAHRVARTLDSLLAQSKKAYEILVVVDGSTDNTAEVLGRYLPHIQIVNRENGGRAVARNTGAGKARGRVLVFVDDDMALLPDSLERHWHFHQVQVNAICGGSQFDDRSLAQTDFDEYRCHLAEKWFSIYPDEFTTMDRSNLFLTAANFSIARDLFVRLGGFDERLSDAEDRELALRALEAGVPVILDILNRGEHWAFCSVRQYCLRLRQYQAANDMVDHNDGVADQSPAPGGLKRLFYKVFAMPLWLRLIDAGILKILPQPIRYRIYDWVTTALGTVYVDQRI